MKTVSIPGGEATFRDPDQILGRGKKVLRAALMGAMGLATKVPSLQGGIREDEEPDAYMARLAAEVADADLDPTDFEALQSIREAAVVAQLESWTLPIPLPTMRTIGDLGGDLYDALLEAVGTVRGEVMGAGFSENSDRESPTDAS